MPWDVAKRILTFFSVVKVDVGHSVNHSIRESVSVSGSVSLRSVLLCFDACFIRAQNLNSFVFLKKEWNFANMYFL